jgi:hypothetical protein
MPRLGSYPSKAAKPRVSTEGSTDQRLERLADAIDRLDESSTDSAARCPLETLVRELDVVIALLAKPTDC